MFDPTTPFGARVAQRLQNEQIIWLTTVHPDGIPQPSPVWFFWDGTMCLIYSKPNTPKLRNIEANSRVALNFDSDGRGGDIVVFTGTAQIESTPPPADIVAAYIQKYQAGMTRIGATPEQFAQLYSVLIRVTPSKLRGH